MTLARADSVIYTAYTDRRSRVWFSVDTGMYYVTIETFHNPYPRSASFHVTGDTSGVSFGRAWPLIRLIQ